MPPSPLHAVTNFRP